MCECVSVHPYLLYMLKLANSYILEITYSCNHIADIRAYGVSYLSVMYMKETSVIIINKIVHAGMWQRTQIP